MCILVSVFIVVLSHPHGVIFPGYIESLLEKFNFFSFLIIA